jgi:hypothetical protein
LRIDYTENRVTEFGRLDAAISNVAAAVWTYVTRTLTSTSAQTSAAQAGANLAVTKHLDYAATLTGITIPVAWTQITMTVKRDKRQTDAAGSLLQITVSNPAAGTDGVLYVNTSAATVAQRTQASLTPNQGTSTVAIAIDDPLTDVLTAGNYTYDLRVETATASTKPVDSASFSVSETETHTL